MTQTYKPSSNMVLTLVLAATGLGFGTGCMRPADPPGFGEQPTWHYERNPATMPTVTQLPHTARASESTDDPDSPGTVRTPPAAAEEPMDNSEPTRPSTAQ